MSKSNTNEEMADAEIEREIALMRLHAYDPGERAMKKLRASMSTEKVLRVLKVYAKIHRKFTGESVH